MRAFSVHGDELQLGLADVAPELRPAVEELGSAVDVVAGVAASERLAAAVADRLVEPLVDGGRLGELWFRAFGDARLECVGGIRQPVATSFESVVWRGHELQVGAA
jgi:hypothetical protein